LSLNTGLDHLARCKLGERAYADSHVPRPDESKRIPAQSDSCDVGLALGGAQGELEAESLEVSSFGVCTTHSQSTSTWSEERSAGRNELVSFASSEKTRGARSAWRCVRNSTCDAVRGEVSEPEEATLEVSSFGVCMTHSLSSNELASFVSSERTRGAREELVVRRRGHWKCGGEGLTRS